MCQYLIRIQSVRTDSSVNAKTLLSHSMNELLAAVITNESRLASNSIHHVGMHTGFFTGNANKVHAPLHTGFVSC